MIMRSEAVSALPAATARGAQAKIDEKQAAALNFYRASELEGGLLLSRLAQRCRDGALTADLLKHGAEEIEHARLWTETMLALGVRPRPTRDTYQRRYALAIGRPVSVLNVLALTHVFEKRVYSHFQTHARRVDTHPLVRATLRRMVEEERGHLSWVRRWLDEQARRQPDHLARIMAAYEAADERIYRALLADYGFAAVDQTDA
jgi:bacterioferritin (cytochrome b1)